MLKKEENSPEFNFLADRLRNVDLAFFLERSKDFKQGFIFSVTLGYNYDASLGNSVDIGQLKILRYYVFEQTSSVREQRYILITKNVKKKGYLLPKWRGYKTVQTD